MKHPNALKEYETLSDYEDDSDSQNQFGETPEGSNSGSVGPCKMVVSGFGHDCGMGFRCDLMDEFRWS